MTLIQLVCLCTISSSPSGLFFTMSQFSGFKPKPFSLIFC